MFVAEPEGRPAVVGPAELEQVRFAVQLLDEIAAKFVSPSGLHLVQIGDQDREGSVELSPLRSGELRDVAAKSC
ncbi:MAG: hypothetical protein OXG57_09935 [Acidimicrobiaceae bacterium]|nr:hypothetical protein [Acidimicrobiaceae bacterium]